MTQKKQIKYGDAVEEIESILTKIESEQLDVDELTAKVKRVSELLSVCKDKLHSTQTEVENILKDIDSE